jgi:hypothetical protein
MTDLETRVARLERKVRGWRLATVLAGLAALAALLLLLTARGGTSAQVTTRRLMVVDDEGRPVCLIWRQPQEEAGRLWLGLGEQTIFDVGTRKGSTLLSVMPPTTEDVSASLYVTKDTGGALSLRHPNGKDACTVFPNRGVGMIHLDDEKGELKWQAPPAE